MKSIFNTKKYIFVPMLLIVLLAYYVFNLQKEIKLLQHELSIVETNFRFEKQEHCVGNNSNTFQNNKTIDSANDDSEIFRKSEDLKRIDTAQKTLLQVDEGEAVVDTPYLISNDNFIPFEEQLVDHNWSAPLESAITDVFINHSYLSDYFLEQLECRTSICEIVISNVSIDAFDAATTVQFAFAESESIQKMTKSFKFGKRDENGSLKLYIGRFTNNFSKK